MFNFFCLKTGKVHNQLPIWNYLSANYQCSDCWMVWDNGWHWFTPLDQNDHRRCKRLCSQFVSQMSLWRELKKFFFIQIKFLSFLGETWLEHHFEWCQISFYFSIWSLQNWNQRYTRQKTNFVCQIQQFRHIWYKNFILKFVNKFCYQKLKWFSKVFKIYHKFSSFQKYKFALN
jgi:hypothetical protein